MECSICLCECVEKKVVAQLHPCCHTFHSECIKQWFKKQNTCPLCRTISRIKHSPQTSVQPSRQTHKMKVLDALELHRYGVTFKNKTTKKRYWKLYCYITDTMYYSDSVELNQYFFTLPPTTEFVIIQKMTNEIADMVLSAYKVLHPEFQM